jgi:hypothetical protein
VACPFFDPEERFDDQAWIKPPRLPLGDPCRGVCRAPAGPAIRPDDATLRDFCNVGYARGHCSRFPQQCETDAVRFSIDGDRGGAILLRYVLERDYSPAGFGSLEYRIAAGGLAPAEVSDVIAGQARIFVESYLRRKNPA